MRNVETIFYSWGIIHFLFACYVAYMDLRRKKNIEVEITVDSQQIIEQNRQLKAGRSELERFFAPIVTANIIWVAIGVISMSEQASRFAMIALTGLLLTFNKLNPNKEYRRLNVVVLNLIKLPCSFYVTYHYFFEN